MKNACFAILIFCGLFAGCGGEKAPEVTDVSTPENIPAGSAAVQNEGPGILRGTVHFFGTVPQPVRLDMAADPVCTGAHPEPVYTQDLAVNAQGEVSGAFVFISEGLPAGAVYAVPEAPVVLDQSGCLYQPHVFGVRTNQPVVIVNSDNTLHNVHGQLKNSPGFNLGMPLRGMKSTKKFTRPEVMAHLKCDVHPWMSAYFGVMEHPFFAVTGADGSFEIRGLPAGNYVLSVWHEKLGVRKVPVEIHDGVSEVKADYDGEPAG